MKAARQIALLSKVDELLLELKSVRIGRVGTSSSAESYGMPRSALGVVVSYLRQQRPNLEELLGFLRAAPAIDALAAQNDANPAAQQTALAFALIPWLEDNRDLSPADILFVLGWVQGHLPNKEGKGKAPLQSKGPKPPYRDVRPAPKKDFATTHPKKEPTKEGFGQLGAALAAKFKLKPQ